MNNIELVVFDLDGTLVESDKTIFLSMEKTLEDLGLKINISHQDFKKYIGWHFKDIFADLNIDVVDMEEYLKIYKSYYNNLLDTSFLYPRVEEILLYLAQKKYKIALVTTKMQEQADIILAHFKLDKYFDYICGRRDGLAHKPSPEPLLLVCNSMNVKPENTIMVGDTEMDIQCGKNANSKTLGVTYGYRSKEFIENQKPDAIVSSLIEIKNIL